MPCHIWIHIKETTPKHHIGYNVRTQQWDFVEAFEFTDKNRPGIKDMTNPNQICFYCPDLDPHEAWLHFGTREQDDNKDPSLMHRAVATINRSKLSDSINEAIDSHVGLSLEDETGKKSDDDLYAEWKASLETIYFLELGSARELKPVLTDKFEIEDSGIK